MTIQTIASKYRRALREETGATFTLDHLLSTPLMRKSGLKQHPAQAWTAFAAGLAISPIATTIACLALRQWIKASIAGGVVLGMVGVAVLQAKEFV